MSDVNFNIGGNVHQAAQSITNNNSHVGDVHNGPQVNINELFESIKSAVPEEGFDAEQDKILDDLREIAASPEPATEPERKDMKSRIMGYIQKLGPYTPYIRRTVAAFADGALRTMAGPAGWVVGGLIEVVRDHRN